MATGTAEEITLWRGHSSQLVNLPTYVVCLLLAAGCVVGGLLGVIVLLPIAALPLLYLAWRWVQLASTEYEVTSERIRIRRGLFTKRTDELELYRVRDHALIEPFWMRLCRLGDLHLTTTDATTPLIVLPAIPQAAALREQVRKSVEVCRERKRVRLAEME